MRARLLLAVLIASAVIAATAVPCAAGSLPPLSQITHAREKTVASVRVRQYGTEREVFATVYNYPPVMLCDPASGNCAAVSASGGLTLSTGGSPSSPGYTRLQDGTTTNLAAVNSAGQLSVALPYTLTSNGQTAQNNSAVGVACVYNTSAPFLTSGQASPCSVGIYGYIQTEVCNNGNGPAGCAQAVAPTQGANFYTSGIGLVTNSLNYGYNGSTGDFLRTMTALTGSGTGVLAVGQEPQTPTYSATSTAISNAGSGVIFEITGAASHVIRIRSCNVAGTATAATYTNLVARVLSTADSGGTSSAASVGALDSASAATAATVVSYTASPTQGTPQAAADARYTVLESSTAGTSPPVLVGFDWPNTENAEPPTLRSASQQFVIFNTSAATGAVYSVSCKFTDTSL